jgi:hypothetical protein
MGHDLVHLRRIGGYQCQAEHGFTSKVGVHAIGGIEHGRIGRVRLAHGVYYRAGLCQILAGCEELHQFHADLHF